MSPTTVTDQEEEAGLRAFLEPLPEPTAVALRTLAHAWSATGGGLSPGRVAVRLLGPRSDDAPPWTAATLHAPRGDAPARLEFARTILEHHGVDGDRFLHWADEIVDLGDGFDPKAKFPTLPLPAETPPGDLVRLVSALRDLAVMAGA